MFLFQGLRSRNQSGDGVYYYDRVTKGDGCGAMRLLCIDALLMNAIALKI